MAAERRPPANAKARSGNGDPRAHRALERLRNAIIAGQYAPGERLIEVAIARDLGTSRGPVREALRRLETEGLVASFPYRGAVVLAVSDEEIQEVLIPIRLTLERYSVLKAIEMMPDGELAELAKQVWLMEQAAKAGDLMKVVEADLDFHDIMISSTGQTHTLQILAQHRPTHSRLLRPVRTRQGPHGSGDGAPRAARRAR